MKKLLCGATFERRRALERSLNSAAIPVTKHNYWGLFRLLNKPGNKPIKPQWASSRVFMGQDRDKVKALRTYNRLDEVPSQLGIEWVTNRERCSCRRKPDKSWRSPFFQLRAFWRGTRCHHHHFQGCHCPGQGSANTPGAGTIALCSRSSRLCLWRGQDISSSGSSLFQLFCKRTHLQSNFPVSKCTWWKTGTF